MKKRKWLGIMLALVLMLTGCSSSTNSQKTSASATDASSFNGDYYKMINTGRGTNSEKLYLEFSSTNDLVALGSGLQYLSTSHFSTDSYYLSEGGQLSNDDYNALLKRDAAGTKNKKYPYTLQVAHGTTLDGIKDPIMADTLSEQDYYVKSGTKYRLAGVSIAIIVNPKNADNTSFDTSMSTSTIKSYSNSAIKKLYKYIRAKKKSLKNLPILIAVYRANDDDVSEINGNYIYQSYCTNGNVGTMRSVNFKYVYFTSTEAKKLDATTYSDFSNVKATLKKQSTESAGLVGTALYRGGTLQSMKMEAHLNVKTYTEMLYLTSVLADAIDSDFTEDFNIRCLVYSQDHLDAIIIKNKGEDVKTTMIEE
jgi:protein involved in sex pheromone biosynthesis